jgi:hypothetical protein
MKCPICKDPDLVMTERQNIEIDYCPQCRGVWLDRGELDKIIERVQLEQQSYTAMPAPTALPAQPAVAPPVSTQSGISSTFLTPPHGGFNDIGYGQGGGRHGTSHGEGHHGRSYDEHQRRSGGFLRKLFD